jgi:cytochrome c oxidase assembly protein subunit 15
MLYFALRKRVRAGVMPHLWVLFVLGGLQGLMGWYMVMSGLVDIPRVSQYRLTAHLGLAVLIYAYMLWLVFDLTFLRQQEKSMVARPLARWSGVMVVLVYLMILSGGLVAGTRAGFAYPTWPLMGDSFIPQGLYQTTPGWLAVFEDITTIQFNHRIFAYLLFVLLNVLAFQSYREGSGRSPLAAMLVVAALLVQVTLGISTLLLHVPVSVATAHQGGAVVLLTATLFLAHVHIRQ